MPGFDFLDVVIGMSFVYLVLSLICSAMHELLEAWSKNRATDLSRGITELFAGGANVSPAAVNALVSKFYQHPFISSLYRGTGKAQRPSYIPARNFALALMDLAQPPADGRLSGAAGATALDAAAGQAEALRKALTNHPDFPADLQQALRTLIDAAGGDPVKVRENIEAWFNSAMDRVSGWYKRRSQFTIFVIGAVVAVTLNVDTVAVANALVRNKNLRSAAVAGAETAVNRAAVPAAGPVAARDEAAALKNLQARTQELQALGLPIGWAGPDLNNKLPDWPKAGQGGDWLGMWLWLISMHWVGWLLSAFAISFGSPFWFDLLNRFMVVRSTVKPQEKSPAEPSKDRSA